MRTFQAAEQKTQTPPPAFAARPLVQPRDQIRPSPATPRLMAKLEIGAVDDPLEREADVAAERVMSTGDSGLLGIPVHPPRLMRKCDACEEEERPQLMPKREAGAVANSAEAPAAVHEVLRSSGRPLDPATRAFMEPRFGADLSSVRIHTDAAATQSARSLNARAYTVGRDIVFDSGLYAPSSWTGRWLLAHELSHTLQTQSPLVLRRQIVVSAPKVDLSPFFKAAGISSTKKEKPRTYSRKVDTEKRGLRTEVLHSLLSSRRWFTLLGEDTKKAETNLNDNIAAREGVVAFAAKKKYTFAAGKNVRMNTKYWEKGDGPWRVKSTVDRMDALNDLNISPEKYKIACERATELTMEAGSNGSPIGEDSTGDETDWVVGDWGYIANLNHSGTPGLEGENLIYVGFQKFWGHFSGNAMTMHRSLQEWVDQVDRWDGKGEVQIYRKWPSKGFKP